MYGCIWTGTGSGSGSIEMLSVLTNFRFSFSNSFLDSFRVPDCQTRPKLGSQSASVLLFIACPLFSISISIFLLSAHAAPTLLGFSLQVFTGNFSWNLLISGWFSWTFETFPSFASSHGGGAPEWTFPLASLECEDDVVPTTPDKKTKEERKKFMPFKRVHIRLDASMKFINLDEALIMKQRRSDLNIRQTPTWRTVTAFSLFLILAHLMILDEDNVSHHPTCIRQLVFTLLPNIRAKNL